MKTTQALPPENLSLKWDNIISAKRNPFQLNLGELWRYRDLILLFFHRDFVSTYKQTVLGPLWFIIQPLFSTLVYTVIFGQIAKLSTSGLPKPVFYLSGIVVWNYFSGCLMRCSSVFSGNAGIFSKVYFPRLTVPIASVLSMTLNAALQLLMLLGFVVYFVIRGNDVSLTPQLLLIPVFALQCALMGIGFGSLVSALTTRYRDLQMALGFGMQLWMYASCVFYPRSEVPANFQWLLTLNPVVPIVEGFRCAVLGSGVQNVTEISMTTAISVVIFFVGVVVFHHVEKDFADTI